MRNLVDAVDGFLEGGFLAGEFVEGLGDLIEGEELVLGVAGLLEGVDEAFAGVHGRLEEHIGVGFFSREFEMSVSFHLFAGGIPPAFESGCI